MKSKSDITFFDAVMQGLEESIQYSKGMLSLRTTVLPEPPPVPEPTQIIHLREKFNMSQAVFAAALNVGAKTVQAWEQGTRVPNQASVRLLQFFEKEPEVAVRVIGAMPVKASAYSYKVVSMSSSAGRFVGAKPVVKAAAKKKPGGAGKRKATTK